MSNKPATLFIVIVMGALLSSCGQSFNSHTSDYLLVASNYCTDQSNTKLCQANEVIQTKCTSCHEGYHDSWGAYNTDDAWKKSGNIVAGNAAASLIVTRLKLYGTGNADMPKGAGALTQAEYDKIKNWIDGL